MSHLVSDLLFLFPFPLLVLQCFVGSLRGDENALQDNNSGLSSGDKSSLSSHHFGHNLSSSNPSSGQDDSEHQHSQPRKGANSNNRNNNRNNRNNNNNINNNNSNNKKNNNKNGGAAMTKGSSGSNLIGAIKVGHPFIIVHISLLFYSLYLHIMT